jgi:hypothetical protein
MRICRNARRGCQGETSDNVVIEEEVTRETFKLDFSTDPKYDRYFENDKIIVEHYYKSPTFGLTKNSHYWRVVSDWTEKIVEVIDNPYTLHISDPAPLFTTIKGVFDLSAFVDDEDDKTDIRSLRPN